MFMYSVVFSLPLSSKDHCLHKWFAILILEVLQGTMADDHIACFALQITDKPPCHYYKCFSYPITVFLYKAMRT